MSKDQHPKDERDEEEQTVKVVDRRRFDDEGNDRSESSAVNSSSSSPSSSSSQQPPKPSATSSNSNTSDAEVASRGIRDADISFSSFVMSLATQALIQLGEIDQAGMPTQGNSQPVNLLAAKEMIEILAMLQRKVKQGLDSAEERLIEEILHNLRLSFIRRSEAK